MIGFSKGCLFRSLRTSGRGQVKIKGNLFKESSVYISIFSLKKIVNFHGLS